MSFCLHYGAFISPAKTRHSSSAMGGSSSKDCWCDNHPSVRLVCPVQISQRYPYLTLADLSKTQDTEQNNAQYGLINSMVFASGSINTGSLGLGLILGVIMTLTCFWIRNKCRRRTKQRVEKRSWRKRFLQAHNSAAPTGFQAASHSCYSNCGCSCTPPPGANLCCPQPPLRPS